jgi:lipopolysaccharide/colanic/teichoic acid biosynthesis glycosyltransferase
MSYNQLIILHNTVSSLRNNEERLLRRAVSCKPTDNMIFDALKTNQFLKPINNRYLAIPDDWKIKANTFNDNTIRYKKNEVNLCFEEQQNETTHFVVSNGRFLTEVNSSLIEQLLDASNNEITTIAVKPELLAYREKIRLINQQNIVGFRRIYTDSAEPAAEPADWPHHIFIKANAWKKLLGDCRLPLCFSDFLQKCRENSIKVHHLNVGGTVLDLEEESSLLGLCKSWGNWQTECLVKKSSAGFYENARKSFSLPEDIQIFGRVSIGENVTIGREVVIAGPTIIGDNVKIANGTVINSSIISSGLTVPPNSHLAGRLFFNSSCLNKKLSKDTTTVEFTRSLDTGCRKTRRNPFRVWRKFSYLQFSKRFVDIIGATAVIILFAPIVPFIAIVLKLNSPGPLFYKARRQGLHGKEFHCLKFRTMIVGADAMQDKLRVINQMDGPQFKIDNDPRVSSVGKFLRDTFIDEIPQFWNVLIGQMSIVGPRPSPEKENTLCPLWRDARLSVKPGVTGLWQVCRTRQPSLDFQEWIHYDIKYVRNASFKLDLWICWQTAIQMLSKFISKF